MNKNKMTVIEVATMFNISPESVYRAMRLNILKYKKDESGKTIISHGDAAKWRQNVINSK